MTNQKKQTIETSGLKAGVRCFNRGDYWNAHEHWEHIWIQLPPPEKSWLQGLIQAAAVFHLLGIERPSPAQRLATSALKKLDGWPSRKKSSLLPIRVTGLKALLLRVARDQEFKRSADFLKKARSLKAVI